MFLLTTSSILCEMWLWQSPDIFCTLIRGQYIDEQRSHLWGLITSHYIQPSTMPAAQNHGLTGAVLASLPILMTLVAFTTIALYNVLELNAIIFTTFKKRSGLYFWSFIVATWGIVPHAVGFILKFFGVPIVWWGRVSLVAIGWIAMVAGQSLVLYSRLHLVSGSVGRIRWVLYMIIFNSILVGIPDVTLAFMANRPKAHASVISVFSTFDKVQVGVFFIQESIISAFYIYETVRLLGPVREMKRNPLGKLLAHLIFVNALVLVLDATLLGTEYSGHFEIQTTYKAAIYSVKLKVEFSVLNRLVSTVTNKGLAFSNPSHNSNSHPLEFLTNTVAHSANSGSLDDAVKDHQQPRVTTTEFVMGGANLSGDTFKGKKLGEVSVERPTSVAESQVRLAGEQR
jgi:hypothetical protein